MAAEIYIGGVPLRRQVRQEILPRPAIPAQPSSPDEEGLVFPPQRVVDEHGGVLYTLYPGDIPERVPDSAVIDVEPPKTVQRDGTKVPTSRKCIEMMNQFLSEKARRSVVALSETEKDFRNSISPRSVKMFARSWFLGTRDGQELYNMAKDWVTWVIVAPIAFFGAKGYSASRADADVRFQVNAQTLQYSELFLDPSRNAGGARLLQMVENNQGNRDLNDKDSWGKDSGLWSVARGISGFWKGIGDNKSRQVLIGKLPANGTARLVLEGLGDRNLTDDEVRTLLQGEGITSGNVTLMQELVEEFTRGDGEVESALRKAKGMK